MSTWFPMPRYRVDLAAEMDGCGHIVWTSAAGGWPTTWIGPLYCPVCGMVGEVRQWWEVQ